MKFQNILVTGGSGFIGSHLVDKLVEEGCNVSVMDNFYTGNPKNIKRHLEGLAIRLLRGDIRSLEAVREATKDVDAVFHLAALISVPQSVEDPVLANEINVSGTLNVLKASIEAGVRRLTYASSCAVYGAADRLPLSEDYLPKPISPYGVSKLAAEHYCRVFYESFGLETVCLRFFNVYGPRQSKNQYSGVIASFLERLIKGEPPIIYGSGEQCRDFIFVKDVVRAMLLALRCKSAAGEVYNIGTGKPITINSLAELMITLSGKKTLKPIHVDERPGDIVRNWADINKMRQTLRFEPTVSVEEGVGELIKMECSLPRAIKK